MILSQLRHYLALSSADRRLFHRAQIALLRVDLTLLGGLYNELYALQFGDRVSHPAAADAATAPTESTAGPGARSPRVSGAEALGR